MSSDRQERDGTISSQRTAVIERAEADGHALTAADVFANDGVSGSTLDQPALERLRDEVFDGRVDVLYVLSPDRLARRYAYQVLLLDEFTRQGVEVRFDQGPDGANRSAEDELLLQVQGVISDYERAKIMERSRRGKLHKARTGSVSVLSAAPFGYRYVPSGDGHPACFQVDLEQARVVRVRRAKVHRASGGRFHLSNYQFNSVTDRAAGCGNTLVEAPGTRPPWVGQQTCRP